MEKDFNLRGTIMDYRAALTILCNNHAAKADELAKLITNET